MYQENGAAEGKNGTFLSPSCVFLITDPKLLLDAPRDYFVAGLADTLAKWYESETIFTPSPFARGTLFTISGSDRQAFARSDYAGLKSSLSD